MADGSQRPIRDLRIGDLVRTETGTAHIRDIIKGREPELVRGLAQGGVVATGTTPCCRQGRQAMQRGRRGRSASHGGRLRRHRKHRARSARARDEQSDARKSHQVRFADSEGIQPGSGWIAYSSRTGALGDDNEQGRLMRSSDEIRRSVLPVLEAALRRDSMCLRRLQNSRAHLRPKMYAPTSEAWIEDAPVVVTRRRRSRSSSRRRSCCRPRRSWR